MPKLKAAGILVFIFLPWLATGQTKSDTLAFEQFDAGLKHYENGHIDSAILVWEDLVAQKIGTNYAVYGNAFFNIPTLYWQLEDFDKAKEWYLKILDSDLRDSDETGSLMEPHTNYKHKSAVALAGLYSNDSNYIETLRWLDLADTTYRYWGFEGSGTNISLRKAYLLEWKTDVLLKLDRTDEAISLLVTELICSGNLGSFFSASEDTLVALARSKSGFKKALAEGLEQMEIIKRSDNDWEARFKVQGVPYCIPISNVYPDWSLPHYWSVHFIEKESEPDKKELIKYIKGVNFYKRL